MSSETFIPADFRATAAEVRPVPGHPGYYASSDGRVYSQLSGRTVMRELKPQPGGKNGRYRYVSLGQDYKSGVHQIIALTFIPMPPELVGVPNVIVHHLNNVGHDNAASNLEYRTQAANLAARYEHGTAPIGRRNHNARLRVKDVRRIRSRRARRESCGSIARSFGLCRQHVHRITTGQRWAHLAPTSTATQRSVPC